MATSRKIALVTGASSGIGKAAAVALAKAGFNVVIAARRKPELDTVAKEIEAAGAECLAVPTDVGVPEQIKNLSRRPKRSSAASTWSSTTPAAARRRCRSKM